MENTIDTIFGNSLLSKIYFTDSNPAKFEIVEVKKIKSEIKHVKSVETFELLKYPINKNGLLSLNIREHIKRDLISKLNFSSEVSEIKYFNVGFLKSIFYKKDAKNLLQTLDSKSDWIITSEEIVSELSSLPEFEYVAGYSDIRLVGKIGETQIFKIKDLDNVIYIGNKDSITAVFNKQIFDDKEISIEYLIQINEKLKKIIVH